MKLYNTLSKTVEEIQPVHPGKIGLYACGFTVYDFTHLGHLRKYTMDDVLIRTLKRAGFTVKFVQNITDVGHLTSDEDTGEDKLEKGARKYGKTVWEVAREFEEFFWRSMDMMGNMKPDVSCRATEHIEEQLLMVVELEKKEFAYVIEGDGVYFDTSKLQDYGKLARLKIEKLQEGSRVEMIEGKKNATDFALWKFERPGENRAMVWESPWAKRSFPGWHIECSAMAMKYLTNVYEKKGVFQGELADPIDIHTGGIDHIPVHHTNEIAQAEASTGKKPFVRYWVHHNFLRIENEKMSKSLGNFFTIDDVLEKGFEPMALRLLLLSTHYRSEMNFTWENLAGSQTAWNNLKSKIIQYRSAQTDTDNNRNNDEQIQQLRSKFFTKMEYDLNTAEAVATLWEVIKSGLSESEKYALLLEFDQVLGLGLESVASYKLQVASISLADLPEDIRLKVEQREQARKEKDWQRSDQLRDELLTLGYELVDEKDGVQIRKK